MACQGYLIGIMVQKNEEVGMERRAKGPESLEIEDPRRMSARLAWLPC